MRLAFFSDLHVHAWPEFGAETRLNDCVSVLSEVRERCKKLGIGHVFFGGDLFHKRGVLYTEPFQRVARELASYKNDGIRFYAVDGNHDHQDREGKYNAIVPLMDAGLVEGVDPARGWSVVDFNFVAVCMFSYCDDFSELERRINAALSEVVRRDADEYGRIGLFHHGFKGARVGTSLEFAVKEPIDAKKLKLHKLFDFVLSGHYHTHQPINGINNGWYIGSPLEHTRCDYRDREERFKGFITLDTDEMLWDQHNIVRPRFVKLTDTSEILASRVKGNFIDLVYVDHDHAKDLKDIIMKAGARGVKLIPAPKAKETKKRRLDIDTSLDALNVMRRYVKHKRPDLDTKDVSEIVRVGRALFEGEET